MADTSERYIACMVLSAVGDAMGYKCAEWEFCTSGEQIHDELEKLGGIETLKIEPPSWIVSDDTVMHLATGDALVKHGHETDRESLYDMTAYYYKQSMYDMNGRAPGMTCSDSCRSLKPGKPQGYHLPFNKRGGGCGAAMRSMCIGLRYPFDDDRDQLVSYAVETGRMTHHHPTGYLGSLASALFVSYAIQGRPPREWGAGLLATLPKALEYVESEGRYVKENKAAWSYFEQKWNDYLETRGLKEPPYEVQFPDQFDVKDRDNFYKSVSLNGWGGASGHDAPMIAYDALLGAGDSWIELCKRGMLHGGDNDSTGAIAGAMFGALYGFKGVPLCNYKNVEYHDRLEKMALDLYMLSHPEKTVEPEVMTDDKE